MVTPLCELAYKYKTDKCPQIKHAYTPFYYEFLKSKKGSIKKVLELGVLKGGSLRMWRDFFPNAQIYGVDIDEETLITEGRIVTYLGDGTNEEYLVKLIEEIGSNIDLFIDDGSHRWEDQVAACKILRPLLKNAIYIIEDVLHPDKIKEALPNFKIETPDLIGKKHRDDRLSHLELLHFVGVGA